MNVKTMSVFHNHQPQKQENILEISQKTGLVVYPGLLAVLSLSVIGSCSLRAVPVLFVDFEDPDAKAQPYFDKPRQNIPTVVEQKTEIGTPRKLCWLMARDSLTETHKTQDYLASVLNSPNASTGLSLRRKTTSCQPGRGAKL